MSLSNYGTSVNSSYVFLEYARGSFTWDNYYVDCSYLYNGLKRPVDSIILSSWIFRTRYFVPISRLEELKRLEVTSRILEEL
jgi:hypothetical protein